MAIEYQLLIGGAIFLTVMLLGHPLVFTLGGLAVLFGIFSMDNLSFLNVFLRNVNGLATNIAYVCAPLFIFMGAVLERSGSADELFEAMYVIFGRIKGGLAITTVIICTLMAAATGIIGASITMMTMLALPAMLKYRYNVRLATGTIMASGCLGTLIPPSIILIIYGGQAQISVGKLFAGGVGAGLLLSALYLIYITVLLLIKPEYGPAISKEEADKYSARQKVYMIIKSIVPTLGLILAVLGSIMFGVATPTEAAALGCVGALLIAYFNKKTSWNMIQEVCYETIKTTAMIMWIVLAASMFTTVFLSSGGADVITNIINGLAFNRWIILGIIFFILFIMGMFIDSYGVLLIGIPIFTPIVYALGFDPLWFGIMFAIMIQASYISPPFAYACFYVKGVAPVDIPIDELYKATIPFLILQVIAIILLCKFPGIITWLPGIIM